jgi:hypothetical protein
MPCFGIGTILAGGVVNHYQEINRAFAIAMILMSLALLLFAVFYQRRVAGEAAIDPGLAKDPELRKLYALQYWGGFAVFTLVVTLPTVLIWTNRLPEGAMSYGFLTYVLLNIGLSARAVRRRKQVQQAILARGGAGPLPPGISERVASFVAAGLTISAVKAHREEHPEIGLKEAKDAVDAYAAGRTSG